MSLREQHIELVSNLYRQSLRLSKSWINRRDLFRAKAVEIRHQFEQNKNITDKYEIEEIIAKTQKMLAELRHPDPIIPALRPDGTKFERNIPTPPLLFKYRDGDVSL